MSQVSLIEMQNRFLRILPRIRTHARIYHRQIGCPVKLADAIQETIGLAWVWFRRLVLQGKHPEGFVSTLASYAGKAVRSGRRVCGQLKAKDALSETAQRRHGFSVGKLLDAETLSTNPLSEALADTPDTDPSALAQAKLDFRAWRRTRSSRDRRILNDMLLGERTTVLSRKYGLSQSRVSQLRADFRADYTRYAEGELAATA